MQSSGERTGGWNLSQADAEGGLIVLLLDQCTCTIDDNTKERM